MSISFWLVALLLLLMAIVILVLPLLRARQGHAVAYKSSNIQLHEEKINELNVDLQEGRIDQAAHKIAKQELDRELLVDTPMEAETELDEVAPAKKHVKLALSLAIVLPVLSLLLYMQLGTQQDSGQAVTHTDEPSVEEMIEQLEDYLQANKGGLKDWVMLARSYKYLGRFGEAANAFVAASALESNPQVMLEHAEVLALMNDKKFSDEARELVLKALKLSPDNVNALWFAGVVEFQFGHYRQSIHHLSQLKTEAEHDPEVNRSMRFYIGHARDKLIAAGEKVAPMQALVPELHIDTEALVSLSIKLEISDEVRAKFDHADAVFVYAKALQGPKMPLAAQRLTVADLPATVVLDDSMAMAEGMSLSNFKQVIVSARVTKSGNAIAQSGDYIGELIVKDVALAKALSIKINNLVQ